MKAHHNSHGMVHTMTRSLLTHNTNISSVFERYEISNKIHINIFIDEIISVIYWFSFTIELFNFIEMIIINIEMFLQ